MSMWLHILAMLRLKNYGDAHSALTKRMSKLLNRHISRLPLHMPLICCFYIHIQTNQTILLPKNNIPTKKRRSKDELAKITENQFKRVIKMPMSKLLIEYLRTNDLNASSDPINDHLPSAANPPPRIICLNSVKSTRPSPSSSTLLIILRQSSAVRPCLRPRLDSTDRSSSTVM